MAHKRLYSWVTIFVVISLITGLWPAPVWAEITGVAPGRPVRDQVSGPGGLDGANQAMLGQFGPGNPNSLQPISVSRVQSAYAPVAAISSTVVVTLTVSSNLAPVSLPAITDTATVTESLDLLSSFDLTADPETVRDMMLTEVLTDGVSLVGATPAPDISGSELRFNLGDLAPLRDAQVVMTLTVPASVPETMALTRGAAVYGSRQGRAVSAGAPAAVMAPDALAPWLVWTEDADLYDGEMLRTLGRLGDDPEALFDFARDLSFEAYEGSLRGTRGTLWSAAGNSVDQSSLLIAMLRAAGIPARYRHGTLAVPDAQDLIASMFPAPPVVRGMVPDSAVKSDPVNDPELLAEVQDHWWVQAYLPGAGWTDLDPSFAGASVGDSFAVPASDGTDGLAELPDAIRHKISIQLTVEKYYSFPIGGLNLQTSVPLTATLSAALAAGRPVNVGFTVETDIPPGLVFSAVEHIYTPYVYVGDSPVLFVGEPIQDLLTSFPLASHFTTGVWLEVDLKAPDGTTERFQRTIKDLIGPDTRLNGGQSQLPPRDESPLIGQNELAQIHVMPESELPREVVARQFVDLISGMPALAEANTQLQELLAGEPTLDEITEVVSEAWLPIQESQGQTLVWLARLYQYATTWPGRPVGAESMLVKSYPDRPKLILLTQTGLDAAERQTTFELLSIRERAIAYPGQNVDAVYGATLLRTTNDKGIEYEIVNGLVPGDLRSGYATMLAASEQGIPMRTIQQGNLPDLAEVNIPEDTKALIAELAYDDHLIIVPEEMVSMDYGEDIAFIAIDPEGNARYADAAGLNAASASEKAIFLVKIAVEVFIKSTSAGFMGGAIAYIVAYVILAAGLLAGIVETRLNEALLEAVGGASGKDILIQLIVLAQEVLGLVAGACSQSPNPGACAGGAALGYLVVVSAIAGGVAGGGLDPSLPALWIGTSPPLIPEPVATGVITPATLLPAVTIDVNVAAGSYRAAGALATSWQDSATHGVAVELFTADNATLSRDGVPLGTGALLAANSRLSLTGSPLGWDVSADGSVSGYAAAGSGLSLGRDGSFAATLAAPGPYTAIIDGGTVLLDAMGPFTGTLESEITGASQITGTAGAPAPTFESAAAIDLSGDLMLSDIQSGSILAGGSPLPAVDSLAVAAFSGSVGLAEGTATADAVAFAGTADFFTVRATASTATVLPGEEIVITPVVDTNVSGAFSLTVEAPEGWQVGVTASGLITATPASTAFVGPNTLLVTVSTATHPGLFATATVVVDVLPLHDVQLTVTPDPLITIPMGELLDPDAATPFTLNHVADGRPEIGGAAYTVAVTNLSTEAHAFDLVVAGLPAGWTVLADVGQVEATVVNLAPGATKQLGLYVIPDQTTLLAAGASFPFSVTVTDQGNGAVTDTANAAFTMPGASFPYLTAAPTRQFVEPGAFVSVTLTTRNVGNVAGSFPITLTVREGWVSSRPISPTLITSAETFDTPVLAPMASADSMVSLTMAGAAVGDAYFLQAASEAGEYNPMDFAAILIASAETAATFDSGLCLADPALRATADGLATAMLALEASCAAGACDAESQVNLVSATDGYLNALAVSNGAVDLATVEAARDALAAAADDAAVEAARIALSAAVVATNGAACEWQEHGPDARFTPSFTAALIGGTTPYTLTVTNNGSVTTTYGITATLPTGDEASSVNLAPGASTQVVYPVEAPGPGIFELEATVVATGTGVVADVRDIARAGLNAVDRFVQLVSVTPNPAFVDVGTSSTALSIDVANVANVPIDTTARLTVTAPGGVVAVAVDVPLSLITGAARNYPLTTIDTSGWAEGLYTITVDLLCSGDLCAPPDSLPDGLGNGILGVGQLLGVEHAVTPAIAAPGSFTVTTTITTEVLAETILPQAQPLGWAPTGIRELERDEWMMAGDELAVDSGQLSGGGEEVAPTEPEGVPAPVRSGSVINATPGFTRTEETDPSLLYAGTWQGLGSLASSGGTIQRSNTLSSTATFTFTGQRVGVGFIGDTQSGLADIHLDGVLQDTVDLYRRKTDTVSFWFDVAPGTHTISVTVLDDRNPLSGNDWVNLDYIDIWDGTPIPVGHFEQDDDSVLLSTQWTTVSDPLASGGSYMRHVINNNSSLWFPFTGDSISLGVFRTNSNNFVDVRIDGELKGYFDIFSFEKVTDTVNLTNLGAGLHVLEVRSFFGWPSVDFFDVPALGPETEPGDTGSYRRLEEFDPAIRYNGLPYWRMAPSWYNASTIEAIETSRGAHIESSTPGNTMAYDFTGEWASIGFVTGPNRGIANLTIDAVDYGDIDLYTRESERLSFEHALSPGNHTITVTVTGNQNPYATDDRVSIDYIDVWDGSPLPAGPIEAEADTRMLSPFWSLVANAQASGGEHLRPTLSGNRPKAWFPFSGESVSVEYLRHANGNQFAVYIDGEFMQTVDTWAAETVTDTISFEGLGPGPHILLANVSRAELWLDRVVAPATTPATPPTCAGYCRVEENDPAVRYNGAEPRLAPTTWTFASEFSPRLLDNDYYAWSDTADDWVSLTFTGTTIAVGLEGATNTGDATVYVDGVLQEVIDTYRRDKSLVTAVYSDLTPGPHTISVTVAGTGHPNATDQRVHLDYFDTWDGTSLDNGSFEVEERFFRTHLWTEVSDAIASGGTYWQSNSNTPENVLWLPFSGDSLDLNAIAFNQGDPWAKVTIDGQYVATINLWSPSVVTRTFSFGGFGPGAHLLQLQTDRDRLAVDTFTTPATGPFYSDTNFTGMVRYEPDHPDMRYDGWSWVQRPTAWNRIEAADFASRLAVNTSGASKVASLTFDGSWVSVGLEQQNGQGVAEIFVDGVSYGQIDLNATPRRIVDTPVTGLVTGTHTVSVTVVSGQVHLDYIDVYDATPVADALVDPWLADTNAESRVHFTGGLSGQTTPAALGGRYMSAGIFGGEAIWFTFLGDSVTFYGFSQKASRFAEVYIDGQFIETVDLRYDFSESPLAFSYTGLGEGPHVMQVMDVNSMRVDGFVTPATNQPYLPMVEWYDDSGAGNGAPFFGTVGMAASFAVGDVTGDGSVEIAVSADDLTNYGTLFLYRGDGADTGGGDPILWSIPFGGGAFRTWVGSPGIAELDGQPGAEIVVNAGSELYALHGDGTTYWVTDTVPAFEVMSAPAFANLDFDESPEIVVNVGDRLYIFEHDGARTWEQAFPDKTLPPVVADITGDGLQDIFATAWNDVVTLYEFNGGSPSIAWQRTLSSTLAGMFGSPAVADIDGQLPGGDPGPEIAVSSYGRLNVLDADGSTVWSVELDPGNPGGVSIADIDGDGEIELVVSMRFVDVEGTGRIYALNADGSLLWSAPAYDSTSANVASVVDVNGDGVWEVAWNGKEQGFTIFNGADGSVLFNEPLVYSLTGTDYPIIADVDDDGFAEIVTTALRGIRVIGFDRSWGPARPLWNQHTYHITNVNDNLSIPFSEPVSWAVHNTYRTQTSLISPMPVYDVVLTHTVGIEGVTVLADTFNVPPDLSADPLFGWDYSQDYQTTVVTRTFQSRLDGLAPGETRMVAESTAVSYDLPGGRNTLVLPPLFVAVPHIVQVSPAAQAVGAGGTALFEVALANPAASNDTYTLTVVGLPPDWAASLPASVPVPAGSAVTVTLAISVPEDAAGDVVTFTVVSEDGAGNTDQAAAVLSAFNALDLAISPALQSAPAGVPATYSLTLTNRLTVPQTIQLTPSGALLFDAPAAQVVPANSSISLPITATGLSQGAVPFTVLGSNEQGATDSGLAALEVAGNLGVDVLLAPATGNGGPLSKILFNVTLANQGTAPDQYDLDVTVPAGWSYDLLVNGASIGSITVPGAPYNEAGLLLVVWAPAGTMVGDYPVSVTATSATVSDVTGIGSATAAITPRGVDMAFAPGSSTTLSALDQGSWQVEVTNTGVLPDSYELSAAGYFAGVASFSPEVVALDPGESTLVTLNTDPMPFALPATYGLHAVATSLSDAQVIGYDSLDVTVLGYEAVEVSWLSATKSLDAPAPVDYLLTVTNTGNLVTKYDLALAFGALAGVTSDLSLSLLPHQTARVVVTVEPPMAGTYAFTATVASATTSASAVATLIVTEPPIVGLTADNDGPTALGGPTTFSAAITSGPAVTYSWDFGDGTAGSGQQTAHTYAAPGVYTAAVTAASVLDTVTATTTVVVQAAVAGLSASNDGPTTVGDATTLAAVVSAGTSVTYSWDFGDGTAGSGPVATHVYAAPGTYIAEVTASNAVSSASATTTVVVVAAESPPATLFLPAVMRP